jgi:hypothetical protein
MVNDESQPVQFSKYFAPNLGKCVKHCDLKKLNVV